MTNIGLTTNSFIRFFKIGGFTNLNLPMVNENLIFKVISLYNSIGMTELLEIPFLGLFL